MQAWRAAALASGEEATQKRNRQHQTGGFLSNSIDLGFHG